MTIKQRKESQSSIITYWLTDNGFKGVVRSVILIILVALLVQLSFVYRYHVQRDLKITSHRISNLRKQTGAQDVIDQNYLQSLYNNQVQHIKTICQTNGKSEPNEETYKHHYYCVLEGYNISFCKVPKGGSTLWIQIVDVLKFGISNIDTFLNAERSTLHRNKTCTEKLEKLSKFQIKYFLISRDPYSRLYSAFVDKSFLHFKRTTNLKLNRLEENNCSLAQQFYSQSFQEFLDKVFDSIRNGDSNPHWTPIFTLCNPCHTDIFLQVKLEDFSKDMKYVFSRLGFSEELQTRLKKLTISKLESLTGITSTVFKSELPKKCVNIEMIAGRLWASFQIQGYIREQSKFPVDLFDLYSENTTSLPTENLMKLVLREMTLNPLSKSGANVQRRRALVQAYSKVHPNTISALQQLFQMDFLMFNYSTTPPIK